jgi:hypothetical protein
VVGDSARQQRRGQLVAILVPTKPQASCFIQCLPTNSCPPTRDCPLATFTC